MFLEGIRSPSDVKALAADELPALAAEIRARIIDVVGRNGGHLASNLGAVELTIALHRVFDSPREPLFFDVGHQCYTHKLLTGRAGRFDTLRRRGGIGGFPNPAESEHDPAVAGHSGSALSLALGVSAAREADGDPDKVVAVLGDASLGNGVTFEALNSAIRGGRNLIVILNDNRMSITPGVGALRRSLNRLITGRHYNRFRRTLKQILREHVRGFRLLRGLKEWLKKLILPPGAWFGELGIRYFGPVDGHSISDLVDMLERVRGLEGPILLHVVTEKGRGCGFASREPTRYHGVKGYSLPDGTLPESSPGFSAAFGKALCALAEKHPEVAAVSAAMLPGTGLTEFARRFPERCYDVGIAEEHAAIFASGLALAGKRPVCALYSTFLQRALDCVYHDAALGKVPVIFAVDRAGVVADGPTHHGIYDPGFLRALPGLTVMSPATVDELAAMLDFAYDLNAPAVIRYSSGRGARSVVPETALESGRAQIVRMGDASAPVIWSLGAELDTALEAADLWKSRFGEACMVVNARFLKPFDAELARSSGARPVISIEDGACCGGLFSALAETLSDMPGTRVLPFCWPDEVLPQGGISGLREQFALSAEDIVSRAARKLGKAR